MKDEVYLETGPRMPALLRRVSWGAIFAGLSVTIVSQLTLTLLGVSIGAATFNPLQEQDPAQGLALGSAIWLLVTGFISMFLGAYVAGRLCGGPRSMDGLLHGVVTWSVATLAMVYMFATATGSIVGGLGTLIGGAMPGGQAQSRQGQSAVAMIQQQVAKAAPEAGDLLPPTGRTEGATGAGQLTQMAQQDPALAAALGRMEAAGGAAAAPSVRQEAVNILVTQHQIPQAQASGLVDEWGREFQQMQAQAGQSAREFGAEVAPKVAQAALWGFIALALGVLVSAWGGWLGTASLPARIETVPAI